MLITSPLIWLKLPGEIHSVEDVFFIFIHSFIDIICLPTLLLITSQEHLATGTLCVCVCDSVCDMLSCLCVGKVKARLVKLSFLEFSIMHRREMWTLASRVYKFYLWSPFTPPFRVWIYRNRLQLKCMKSLLAELQTFFLLKFVLTFLLKGYDTKLNTNSSKLSPYPLIIHSY